MRKEDSQLNSQQVYSQDENCQKQSEKKEEETQNQDNGSKKADVPRVDEKNMSIDPMEIVKSLHIKKALTQLEIGELMYLIFYILNFPSLEEAEVHSLANRLGLLDIKKQSKMPIVRQYCKCCGYAKQEEVIPLCNSFDNFPSVGLSTYLFFQTIRSLVMLIFLVLVVHDLFALISNLYTAVSFNSVDSQVNVSLVLSWISLNSKVSASNIDSQSQLNKLYLVQMWIGIPLVIFWSLLLYLIKYYARKYEVMVDKQTVSAADFSIIIENYPRLLSKQMLQQQLNEYAMELECQNPDIFRIQEICLNSDQVLQKLEEQSMKQINQKYLQMLDMFADWVCCLQQNGSLPFTQSKRASIYQKFQKVKNQRLIQAKRIYKTLFHKKDQSQNQLYHKIQGEKPGKTIAVVTFKYSESKDLMSRHNQMNFAKKIRYILRCCPNKTKFILKDENGNERDIKIEKAPEPQDIKWQNLSFSVAEKVFRKGCTYFATLILLSISFSIVYTLSIYQRNNQYSQFLNFAVSFVISLVNFIIGFLIRFLTVFEKDYTQTGYQTSLAIKSIWAQLLNSIIVPIVVNYIIEDKNIFGNNGLSTDIIYLAVTNSFLPPLTRLIDPYHKYITLRALYYRKSLKERLLMKQVQLNQSQEMMEFETGYQYIYFINLYLFTAFFVTLQPCISIFAVFGMIFMYWVEKYSVLNRMRRPVPGTDLVNSAMGQMVNLGPIFYSIGALSWSHILDGYKVQQGYITYYAPNIIAAGLSALFFIFPFNVLFDKYLPKLELEDLDYQQCRILLNSQYKRTNPATMQQAIKQYEEYLQNYMKKQESNEKDAVVQNVRINIRKKSEKQKKNVGFSSNDDKNQSEIQTIQNVNINIPARSTKKIGTFIKNVEVDETYLNRKKEMLLHRTRLRSGIGSSKNVNNIFEEIIQHDLKNKDNKIELEQQEDANKLGNEEVEKISNVDSMIKKASLIKNKQNVRKMSNFREQKLVSSARDDRNYGSKVKQAETSAQMFKQVRNMGNRMAISNRDQLLNEEYKLQKQKQSKPKKIVDIDFSKFLPLQKAQFSQGSPQLMRDDSYCNFFAKNLLIKKDSEKQNKVRKNNPYENSFR